VKCYLLNFVEFHFTLEKSHSNQGAGREVVAHLVQASELVANLTKWQTRRDFLKRVNEFLPGKWDSLLF
jgi:hypothetical protein